MKLKFKKQAYQTKAVEAVVECFSGQPMQNAFSYQVDPGVRKSIKRDLESGQMPLFSPADVPNFGSIISTRAPDNPTSTPKGEWAMGRSKWRANAIV